VARYSGTLARRILGPLDSASARLLLVEDNPRHAQLFTAALGEAGVAVAGAPPFELSHVETLAAALARLAEGDIDLVLLDLTLPDGRGLDPLIEMRARFPDAPVVVFTTAGDDLLPGQALQAGAQDYLAKGRITSEMLARTIRHALEVNRLQSALRSLSLLDGLTGLYNRRGFVTLAEPHLKLAQRAKGKFLVFSIDVAGLATINQAVGLDQGDHVLREVAEMLRRCFRDSDLLARLEHGAFAVLAADAGSDTTSLITNRIARLVTEYNGMTLRAYTLKLTVGCAPADAAEGAPIESLLQQAADGRRASGAPPSPGGAAR
jgi:diguanylate cyclase (GGDEF)-like protein